MSTTDRKGDNRFTLGRFRSLVCVCVCVELTGRVDHTVTAILDLASVDLKEERRAKRGPQGLG